MRSYVLILLLIVVAALAGAEEREGERDKDSPRDRAQFLTKRRGRVPAGKSAGEARLRALRQRDSIEEREFQRFERLATPVHTYPAVANGGAPADAPQAGSWTPIGPQVTHEPDSGYQTASGRITSLATHPTDNNVVYLGAAQGGLWKYIAADPRFGGRPTWTPLTDHEASLAVGSVAVSPSGVIYVGTGEDNEGSDSYYGAGILKSTDGGASWQRIGDPSFNGAQGKTLGGVPAVGAIAINPANENDLLVGFTGGSYYIYGGLFRSTDGGATWQRILLPSQNAVTSVAWANATTAYIGLYSRGVLRVTIDAFNNASVSDANGAAPANIATASTERVKLALSPENPNYLYAAVAKTGGGLAGVYVSANGGGTWTKSTLRGLDGSSYSDVCGTQCWYDLVITANPRNHAEVFLGGASHHFLLRSRDAGATWQDVSSPAVHPDQHAIAFSHDGTRIFVGNDGGFYSGDLTSAAMRWTELNSDPTVPGSGLSITQFYGNFDIHPTDAAITLGGTQDNGVQRYSGSADWQEVTCGDGAGALFDPANPQNVIANCQRKELLYSQAGGGAFSYADMDPGAAINDEGLFIAPVALDPHATNAVYFGGHKLWRSLDHAHWSALTGDLTSGATTAGISAIAFSPRSRAMFLGTSDGNVYAGDAVSGSVTRINGARSFRYVSALAPDPNNAQQFVLTQTGFGTQHVFLNASASAAGWLDITFNLPDAPVQAAVFDPAIPNRIYIAGDAGVFYTDELATPSSLTWHSLSVGLPNVAVFGLRFHQPSRTLRAATHGRGMWDRSVPEISNTSASLKIEPASLDFGDQLQSAVSAPRTFALTNTGRAYLHVQSITTSGADFIAASGCVTLLPGQSCEVTATFQPSALGERSAFLTVTTDVNGLAVRSALTGFGTRPAPNDEIAEALDLPTATTFTINNATGSVNDPRPSACEAGTDTRNHTVWYRYVAPQDGWLSFDTAGSAFDTVLSIWTGAPSDLRLLACDDDVVPGTLRTSEISGLPVTAGATYYVMVASYYPQESGVLTVHSSFQTAQMLLAQQITSASVASGQAAHFRVNIPFQADTALALTVSPATASIQCAATPGSLKFLGSGGTRQAAVDVTCTTQGTAPMRASLPPIPYLPLSFAMVGGILLFPRRRAIGLALVAMAAISTTACGGGTTTAGSQPPTAIQQAATPKGTYTVTLSAAPAAPGTTLPTLTLNVQ